MSDLKTFLAECLIDVSKVFVVFKDYQVPLKFHQKLVSLLFCVSIYVNYFLKECEADQTMRLRMRM